MSIPSTRAFCGVRLHQHGLRLLELWPGDDEPIDDKFDLVRRRGADAPASAGEWVPFETLRIALGESEDELLARVAKDVRYEIRRAAGKDGLTIVQCAQVAGDELWSFARLHDETCAQRGLPVLGAAPLMPYVNARRLELTFVSDGNRLLAGHAYIVGRRFVRLFRSAAAHHGVTPAERALVGRANRLLHWRDLLWYRARDFDEYDLGGWYGGSDDTAKLSVNAFKEGFGGVHAQTFDGLLPASPVGKAYLRLLSARQVVGRLRTR